MSEFHDHFPEYELMAHHSEEEGVQKRKQLWKVFFIMLGITIFELFVGFYVRELGLIDADDRSSTSQLKVLFIGLTLAKAFYIVYHFMHLGHEKKGFKFAVLAPYSMFILYFIYVIVAEANYSKVNKTKMDPLIAQQKATLNAEAKSGVHGHEAKHAEEHESAPAHH
jgi:cytochrome c oxidase subunit IV